MEGADGTYEEFPEQSRDDYEPMNSSQIFIDMSQVQTEAKEPLFSPLVSPMRGTPKEGKDEIVGGYGRKENRE